MGAKISIIAFQPALLGVAIALLVVALIYKDKAKECNFKDIDGSTKNVGKEIFKVNLILAAIIIAFAAIINVVIAIVA